MNWSHLLTSRVFGVISVVILIGLLVIEPDEGISFLPCPFHKLTGYPCPGCGMTRALSHCTHGHFEKAFWLHPFSFAFFFALLFSVLHLLSPKQWKKKLSTFLRAFEARNPKLVMLFLIAIILFGSLRLLYYLIHPIQ